MKSKNGISLIVLVITIIVMIVLAGAIILSLNNAGIIEKANKAVKDTDLATVKELASMAWAEAYATGVRKVEGDNGLRTRVEDALRANGINEEGNIQYFLKVTQKGVTVKPIEEVWILDSEKLKVKRGKEELTIGQTINYDETAGGTETGLAVTDWKVLGADTDGNLLIMSTSDIKTSFSLYTESTSLSTARSTWLSGGVNKLNSECEKYGKGIGAIGARSITVEDIDKVVGYDKTTYSPEAINKYGNKVTYIYSGTTRPKYIGEKGAPGQLSTEHTNGFYWYDEEGAHRVKASDLTNEDNIGKEIAIITSNYYSYSGISLLSEDSEAYKMVFGTSDSYNNYWLASPYVNVWLTTVDYGMRYINSGAIYNASLWISTGRTATPVKGVRVVVTLDSDIPLTSLVQ